MHGAQAKPSAPIAAVFQGQSFHSISKIVSQSKVYLYTHYYVCIAMKVCKVKYLKELANKEKSKRSVLDGPAKSDLARLRLTEFRMKRDIE